PPEGEEVPSQAEEPPKRSFIDALLNRQPKPKPPLNVPLATELGPQAAKWIERYKAAKNDRGAFGRMGRQAHLDLLDKLYDAAKRGVSAQDIGKLGVGYGQLRELDNNVRQSINAIHGGIATEEGAQWARKLAFVRAKYGRALGANKR